MRTVGDRDRIDVTRSDGTEVSWSFPSYGDGLPHDLVHLVVESAFGLRGGFWGRVDGGADPQAIDAEANRKGGRDKYAAFGADRTQLMLAEALANAAWGRDDVSDEELEARVRAAHAEHGSAIPGDAVDRVRRTRTTLRRLAGRWQALTPKGARNLAFEREQPSLDSLEGAE